MKKPVWVIQSEASDEFNRGEKLYWSNKDGWVDKCSATRFTAARKNAISYLPKANECSGSHWVKLTGCKRR